MINKSREHLVLTNETYIQHFKFATCIGISMIYGGMLALVHAIYPGILTKSASNRIINLNSLISNRSDNNIEN